MSRLEQGRRGGVRARRHDLVRAIRPNQRFSTFHFPFAHNRRALKGAAAIARVPLAFLGEIAAVESPHQNESRRRGRSCAVRSAGKARAVAHGGASRTRLRQVASRRRKSASRRLASETRPLRDAGNGTKDSSILLRALVDTPQTTPCRPAFGLAYALRTRERSVVLIATSVRFFARNFFMMWRTCTFTVLSHILRSYAMILLGLPC